MSFFFLVFWAGCYVFGKMVVGGWQLGSSVQCLLPVVTAWPRAIPSVLFLTLTLWSSQADRQSRESPVVSHPLQGRAAQMCLQNNMKPLA